MTLPRMLSLAGFVSHNWASNGRLEALALALHLQNHIASSVCAGVAWAIVLAVTFAVKEIGMHEIGSHFFALISLVTVVITAVVKTLVMLYGHRLPSCGRGGKKGYYLDICCINQESSSSIEARVRHLTEYILASSELIALWTPRYATRVWCICELAMFFRRACLLKKLGEAGERQEVGRIVFLPLWMPPMAQAFSLSFLILSVSVWYYMLVAVADEGYGAIRDSKGAPILDKMKPRTGHGTRSTSTSPCRP